MPQEHSHKIFPEALDEYLSKINEIFSQIAIKQEKEAKTLDKRAREVAETEEAASKKLSESNRKLELAEQRLIEADQRYEAADKIAKVFEAYSDKEKEGVTNLLRKVTRIKEEIKAGKREIETREKELLIKEGQIEDKQQALTRTYTEVEAKAKRVGIVL